MRRGFGRNNRGQEQVFAPITQVIGMFLQLLGYALLVFAILFVVSYFVEIPGLGGLKILSHNLIDGTPIGAAIQQVGSMWEKMIYNPTSLTEEEVKTDGATGTSAATGVKLNDPKSGTGILSQNPQSGQAYQLQVGVSNPMKELIAKNSKLQIGNPTLLLEKTGLNIGPLKWDNDKNVIDLNPAGSENSYALATADSVAKNTGPDPDKGKTAKIVSTIKAVEPTNMFLEVDYSYDFKSVYEGDTYNNGKPVTFLTMYHAKFIVASQETAKNIEKNKDFYRIKDYATPGPVTVSRVDTQPFLEPGKAITLRFKIKNANPNSDVFEAVDFKSTSSLGYSANVRILIDKGLESALDKSDPNNNLYCADIGEYQRCTIKNLFVSGQSNINARRDAACGTDGCLFQGNSPNGYSEEQGFSETDSHILTDEAGSDEKPFSASLKLSPNADPDKVYNVYVIFIEDAYTYHAAMKKAIAVQPG